MHASTPGTSQTEGVTITPGFIAFVGALVLPAIVALVVYLGAWAVSGEVYAAEAQGPVSASGTGDHSSGDVAGWKRALVGVCPIH